MAVFRQEFPIASLVLKMEQSGHSYPTEPYSNIYKMLNDEKSKVVLCGIKFNTLSFQLSQLTATFAAAKIKNEFFLALIPIPLWIRH
jgi:hypothetical protein